MVKPRAEHVTPHATFVTRRVNLMASEEAGGCSPGGSSEDCLVR